MRHGVGVGVEAMATAKAKVSIGLVPALEGDGHDYKLLAAIDTRISYCLISR